MRTSPARAAAAGCALALMLMFGGCSRVVETSGLVPGPAGYGPTCHSSLGAYYLPRALLQIKATAGANSITSAGLETNVTMVADRDQPFCLDYLSSPTSDDLIVVKRDPKGLLVSVTSEVEDRTPEIANALIETAEAAVIAAARAAALEAARDGDRLDVEFDPFVWQELLTVNRALKRFGFCLYVEGRTFPIDGLDPATILAAGRQWCALENPPVFIPPGDEFSALPVAPEVMRTGILYRPNIAHKIVILRKSDPSGRRPWQIYQTRRVEMPNVSPILSIGVERAMFATRKTTLAFNRGVLTDVTIEKGSELAGFVSIPLNVARAVVRIPGEIVTLRITDTSNRIALINAQIELMKAVNERNAAAPASAAPRSADARSGQFVGACLDARGPLEGCEALARSRR